MFDWTYLKCKPTETLKWKLAYIKNHLREMTGFLKSKWEQEINAIEAELGRRNEL